MKHKLTVEIDYDGENCGNCRFVIQDYNTSTCGLFIDSLRYHRDYENGERIEIHKRCKQCIETFKETI